MLKSKKKVIVSLSIILFIILLAFLVYKSSNYTIKGIENYDEEYCNFSLDEIGDYEDIYYQYTKKGSVLFNSSSAMIIADYDDLAFNEQLNAIASKEYQKEAILFDETKFKLPNTEFCIGGWNFKILKNSENDYDYPKLINFIAVNEVKKEIAYLTFFDYDMDYLCTVDESNDFMSDFIIDYFKYDFNAQITSYFENEKR